MPHDQSHSCFITLNQSPFEEFTLVWDVVDNPMDCSVTGDGDGKGDVKVEMKLQASPADVPVQHCATMIMLSQRFSVLPGHYSQHSSTVFQMGHCLGNIISCHWCENLVSLQWWFILATPQWDSQIDMNILELAFMLFHSRKLILNHVKLKHLHNAIEFLGK